MMVICILNVLGRYIISDIIMCYLKCMFVSLHVYMVFFWLLIGLKFIRDVIEKGGKRIWGEHPTSNSRVGLWCLCAPVWYDWITASKKLRSDVCVSLYYGWFYTFISPFGLLDLYWMYLFNLYLRRSYFNTAHIKRTSCWETQKHNINKGIKLNYKVSNKVSIYRGTQQNNT